SASLPSAARVDTSRSVFTNCAGAAPGTGSGGGGASTMLSVDPPGACTKRGLADREGFAADTSGLAAELLLAGSPDSHAPPCRIRLSSDDCGGTGDGSSPAAVDVGEDWCRATSVVVPWSRIFTNSAGAAPETGCSSGGSMALSGDGPSAGTILAVSSGASFLAPATAPRSGRVLIFTSVPIAGVVLGKSGGPSD